MKKYLPHKYQLEFHQSGARFRTFIAGRRGGKSLAGTIEALRWADLKPRELGRPTHGMVIAPTYGMLQDVNISMIMDWCPEHAIESWNKVDKNLVLVNGSTISFRSADNPDRLRGTEKDWIWLDEARDMSKYVWEVVYPVLTTTNGYAWVTTTPQGYDWVYETFYKPALQGDKDFQAWQFTTLDNPHIDADMVEKAKKDLSEVMFKQEYMATFEKFEGLVYPDFSEKRHVKTGYKDITDNYFVGLDVGWNHPTACVLVREDKDRVLYVEDEFREQHLTVDMISNRLNGMLTSNGLTPENIEMFLIDPASRGTSQTSGQSILDQLLEKGWGFVPGNNNVMSGINRMTKLLKEDKLFVSPKCEKLVEELNTYHWRKWREEGDGERNKPFKVGEDLADALRYVVASRPDWFEHRQVDMYGRLVEPGADPITGFKPEQEGELVDILTEGSVLDDVI